MRCLQALGRATPFYIYMYLAHGSATSRLGSRKPGIFVVDRVNPNTTTQPLIPAAPPPRTPTMLALALGIASKLRSGGAPAATANGTAPSPAGPPRQRQRAARQVCWLIVHAIIHTPSQTRRSNNIFWLAPHMQTSSAPPRCWACAGCRRRRWPVHRVRWTSGWRVRWQVRWRLASLPQRHSCCVMAAARSTPCRIRGAPDGDWPVYRRHCAPRWVRPPRASRWSRRSSRGG